MPDTKKRYGNPPPDWRIAPLGDIATINPPKPVEMHPDTPVTFIPMADITLEGAIARRSTRTFSDIKNGYSVFQEQDILIAKITPCFENGKCALATGLVNGIGIGSTEFHVIRVKNGMSPRFLLYHARSQIFRKHGEASMTGSAGQKRVPTSFLKTYPVPVPPPQEQQAIIEILETWDRALTLNQRLIHKKETLRIDLLKQLFNGLRREWSTAPLGKLASVKMGQAPSSRFYNKCGDGLPLIQGKTDFSGIHTVPTIWTTHMPRTCAAGDILMTVRAPVGAVARTSIEACIGRGVCAISPFAIDRSFLFHALRRLEGGWEKFIQGSTFAGVNRRDIKQVAIEFPSDRAKQSKIGHMLDTHDLEITLLEREREHLILQREALLTRLLYPQLTPREPGGKP